MKRLLVLLLIGLLAGPIAAQPARAEEGPTTAAEVTERGRDIPRILDLLLVPRTPPGEDGRVLVLLLDVTPSLLKSDLPGELELALERNAEVLSNTRIGVARTGRDDPWLLAPTADVQKVVDTVKATFRGPSTRFLNVYADLRTLADELGKEAGRREVVLLTLENGDAEDDVEGTVRDLHRADVSCSIVCREAFLSDVYWIQNPQRGPEGTQFTGADNAFPDMPWGWRFQWAIPNNSVLSGYAMYGLTRLAAATGGRVYLYYPPSGPTHTCTYHPYCRCLFCQGDHDPEAWVYRVHPLRAVSPPATSREEILRQAASDPYYRAIQHAWNRASKAGLVFARPSLKRSAGVLKVDVNTYRGWTPLGSTVSFSSEKARSRKLARAAEDILEQLVANIERARSRGGGIKRYEAIAETTALQLRITHFNLHLFAAYCDEVGPVHARRRASGYEAPDKAPYGDLPRFRWIGFTNLSLCHGVEPFRQLRLPGGSETTRALRALQDHFDTFSETWAHTPYYRLARACALARFHLVLKAGGERPGQRRPKNDEEENVVTLPERPARPRRPARAGSGTSSGAGGTGSPTTAGD